MCDQGILAVGSDRGGSDRGGRKHRKKGEKDGKQEESGVAEKEEDGAEENYEKQNAKDKEADIIMYLIMYLKQETGLTVVRIRVRQHRRKIIPKIIEIGRLRGAVRAKTRVCAARRALLVNGKNQVMVYTRWDVWKEHHHRQSRRPGSTLEQPKDND